MRRVCLFLLVFAVLVPGTARALTLRDLVELSRAGLGDDVLLALIDVDRPVFAIDAATLKSLKAAGVSERVIVAVVRSGRMPVEAAVATPEPVAEEPVAPAPQVVVIDHHDPVVREVAVPVPVYIPVVPLDRRTRVRDADRRNPDLTRAPERKAVEPEYWGWGGKRRPDAWKDPRDLKTNKDEK